MRSTAAILRIAFAITILSSFAFPSLTLAQGVLRGVIQDKNNNEALPGVTVLIQGTSLGAVTDIAGEYKIVGIPSKVFTVRISYIGYITQESEIDFSKAAQQVLNLKLAPDVIQTDEVVVTAQLRGQMAAVNQQINSSTIANIVAKDRIQELPDNNAAESIGRLPGISIQREAGEGSKVIIRGLPAKFTPITIDGQKIPSTDQVDRSVDLTMISSDMLAGIEVSKAITADKDGDAVGGTVNFEMKKAEPDWKTELKVQGGYNRIESSYDNFRAMGSISNRFMDNLLGVFAEANYQKAQRGSDELSGSYSIQSDGVIAVGDISLFDRHETRNRYGGNLVLDYELGQGNLKLSSLYSRTERDELQRRRRYTISSAIQQLTMTKKLTNIDLLTNTFSYKYDFDLFKVNVSGNYSLSRQETPFNHDTRFEEKNAYVQPNVSKMQGPAAVIADARNDINETPFRYDYLNDQNLKDHDLAAKFDIEVPRTISDLISVNFKFGGKYRGKERTVDNNGVMTESYLEYRANPLFTGNTFIKTPMNGYISVLNFMDPNASVSNFMNGDYDFGKILSYEKIQDFLDKYRNNTFTVNNGTRRLYVDDPEQMLDDYTSSEGVTAGYAMAEFKIGPDIIIIPGIRYERTALSYKAMFGSFQYNDDGSIVANNAKDTVGTISYEDFLPTVNMRVNLAAWSDLRLGYSNTISRPDYYNLVPRENYSQANAELKRGQPYLDRIKVKNYDAAFSFYGPTIGLFSIGGYYKVLNNIDYVRRSRISYGQGAVTLIQPENIRDDTKVYGIEIELQSNLRLLPSPFDGIVFSANYSRIHSETVIPWTHYEMDPRGPRYPLVTINDTRVISMPGQSDQIANLTIGYEKGNFSGRLSFIYQAKTLAVVGDAAGLDGFIDDYQRWDLSMQYKLPYRVVLTANINNLTDLPDRSYLSVQGLPTQIKHYGLIADFGLKYEL